MLKREITLVVTVLLLVLFITACQHETAGPQRNTSLLVDDNGRIKGQLSEHLSVDAEVRMPLNAQAINTYFAALLQLNDNVQDLKTQLLGHSPTIQYEAILPGGGQLFQTSDGNELSVAATTVRYFATSFQPMQQVLFRYITPGDTAYDLSRFHQRRDKDLPFRPRQEVESEVKNMLASLGITAYSEVESYALDYRTMQTQEQIMKDKGDLTSPRDGSILLKDQWSEDDDMYYMVLLSSLDGIPVYPFWHGHPDASTHVAGTFIEAAYSKRGPEYFVVRFPYKVTSTAQENVKIIGAEEALEAIKQKYDGIILTDPIRVTAITLFYVPTLLDRTRNNFVMVPSWVFDMEQVVSFGGEQDVIIRVRTIVDATTGKEIL